MIMGQTPLPKMLDVLCSDIEKQHPGMLCSVLLLDPDGVTLRNGAAPSLPREFTQSIDGVKIGPSTGSCGTALYRKQPVIVSDIETDPLWADFRNLALPRRLASLLVDADPGTGRQHAGHLCHLLPRAAHS